MCTLNNGIYIDQMKRAKRVILNARR